MVGQGLNEIGYIMLETEIIVAFYRGNYIKHRVKLLSVKVNVNPIRNFVSGGFSWHALSLARSNVLFS